MKKYPWYRRMVFLRDRKGMEEGIIVTVIMMAVIMILALRFYSAAFQLMRGIGEDYFFCLAQKVVSAYTKVPVFGLTVWGASCTPIFHTLALVADSDDPNVIDLGSPFPRKEYENIAKWYNKNPDNLEDQNDRMKKNKLESSDDIASFVSNKENELGENGKVPFLLEYRFEEAIAKGMKRCWGRNGQGDLPIGEQWHEGFFKNVVGDSTVLYCDLCEVIQFEEDVASLFASAEEGRSMDRFLKNNPTSRLSTESFWEFIRDDATESDFFSTYKYGIRTKSGGALDNNDLAIVYKRFNRQQLSQLFEKFKNLIDEMPEEQVFDTIELMPLEKYQERCKVVEVRKKP